MLLQIHTLLIVTFGRPNFKNFYGSNVSVNTFNTLLEFHTDIPLKLLPDLISHS